MRVPKMLFSLIIIAAFGFFLASCTVLANRFYVPPPQETAEVSRQSKQSTDSSSELEILTWNVGYAGMGRESDFIMDKGTQLRPLSAELVDKNLKLIVGELRRQDADIFLIQEAARPSWSTYRRDVLGAIERTLPEFDRMFGADVDTKFVPPPFNVKVGNAIFSRFEIKAGERRGLPLEPDFQWGIFRKGYRMHVARLAGQTSWVIVNLHLSTFDSNEDNVREKQVLEVMRFAKAEFDQGSHVVIGGDWNLRLTDNDFLHSTEDEFLFWIRDFPEEHKPEGWKWAVDAAVPSVRTAHKPYVDGENFILTVDGFLVSPNVEIRSVKGIDLGFQFSDHNPVLAVFRSR